MIRTLVTTVTVILLLALSAASALSQSTVVIDGPPVPVAPEVITRDSAGHATVRAIKLTSPLRVDGKLDEDVYQREQPFGGFG